LSIAQLHKWLLTTWPQRKRTTKEHCLEERSGEGDVDSRIQVKDWRKMEAAAQNRAENGQEWSVAAYVPTTGSE